MQQNQLECVLVQNPRFKWSAKRFSDTEISTSHHQRSPTLLTSRTPYTLNANTSQINPISNQELILTKSHKAQCPITATWNVSMLLGEIFANTEIV